MKQQQPKDDSQPITGLSELRDVVPPPSLVPGVMRRLDEPRRLGFWSWLRQPRRLELRLSPLGALAMVLATAGLLTAAVGAGARSRTPDPAAGPTASAPAAPSGGATTGGATTGGAAATAPGTVMVRFVLYASGASRVALAGDFNGWSTDETLLEDSNRDGRFVTTVALPHGDHHYMFVVDGKWVTDPTAEARRPDGFGRVNALLRI